MQRGRKIGQASKFQRSERVNRERNQRRDKNPQHPAVSPVFLTRWLALFFIATILNFRPFESSIPEMSETLVRFNYSNSLLWSAFFITAIPSSMVLLTSFFFSASFILQTLSRFFAKKSISSYLSANFPVTPIPAILVQVATWIFETSSRRKWLEPKMSHR